MSLCRLLFRLGNFSLSSLARHQDGRLTLAASDHELILMLYGSSFTCKQSLLSGVKGTKGGSSMQRTFALMKVLLHLVKCLEVVA